MNEHDTCGSCKCDPKEEAALAAEMGTLAVPSEDDFDRGEVMQSWHVATRLVKVKGQVYLVTTDGNNKRYACPMFEVK